MLYRWDQSSLDWEVKLTDTLSVGESLYRSDTGANIWYSSSYTLNNNGSIDLNNPIQLKASPNPAFMPNNSYFVGGTNYKEDYIVFRGESDYSNFGIFFNLSKGLYAYENPVQKYTSSKTKKGTFIQNVYSSNQNVYPTNGQSGNYWYIKAPHNYSMKVRCC